jgi:hypothetical protein
MNEQYTDICYLLAYSVLARRTVGFGPLRQAGTPPERSHFCISNAVPKYTVLAAFGEWQSSLNSSPVP